MGDEAMQVLNLEAVRNRQSNAVDRPASSANSGDEPPTHREACSEPVVVRTDAL